MNLKGPQMTNSDGTVDHLVLGVPRTWEQMANVPKQGIFEATYGCNVEDRNLKVRREAWRVQLSRDTMYLYMSYYIISYVYCIICDRVCYG